jgi:hypothetical protein
MLPETVTMSVDGRSSGDRLLNEVVLALRRAETVPPEVIAAANAAYAWRSVATAIAGLEFDSAVDSDDGMVGVRDVGSERRLRFRYPGRVLDVSVIDGGRRLVGRFQPPLVGAVVLRRPGGVTTTTGVDDLGQFLFDEPPRGPISLRSVPADPDIPGFDTEWVTT